MALKTADGIEKTDTSKVGSYLSFKVNKAQGEIVLMKADTVNKYLILLSLIVTAAVIISGYIYYRKKKK